MRNRPLKIGILTFHEIFNPGAFLQAYATQELLKGMGHEPEIIDYNPPLHRHTPLKDLWKYNWRMPFRWRKWVDALIRDRAFAKARESHMLLSPNFRTRDEIASQHYDAVLVGADIVWNFKMKRLGNDPIYFGEGLNTDRLIAFAPSCGDCSVGDETPEYVGNGLSKFGNLSARDQNTADVVEGVCGIRPQVICDPTFHLLGKLPRTCHRERDYILIYIMASHASADLVGEIKELRLRTALPVRAVLYRNAWADSNIMDCDPFQWLELIQGARYVVTNTFHGTIFSMLTGSDFIVELNSAIKNKTEGLIADAGLACRLFSGGTSFEDLLNTEINFDRSYSYVKREVDRALVYLENALK